MQHHIMKTMYIQYLFLQRSCVHAPYYALCIFDLCPILYSCSLEEKMILHTINLKTEAACFSKMLTPTFQTTWCHNMHFLILNLCFYLNFSEETAALQEAQLPLPQRLDFFVKYQRTHFLSSSKPPFKLIKLFSE